MQKDIRAAFNQQFTEATYHAYLNKIDSISPGSLDFRIAETPIFIPKAFTQKMLSACEDIIDVIIAPNFKELTET